MEREIKSIFKVASYVYSLLNNRPIRYPKRLLDKRVVSYFNTLQEVECYIKRETHALNPYAFLVYELPLGWGINMDDQYLSFRVYLPDGSLWGKNMYANYIPRDVNSKWTMFWRSKHVFWGREPEEIKFQSGDIVEILGCPGNIFWNDGEVTLGIVVKTPHTVGEVATKKRDYLATHNGFDVTDTGLAYVFNSDLDTYEVLVPSIKGTDHVPTICAMKPSLNISPQRKGALKRLYYKWIQQKS